MSPVMKLLAFALLGCLLMSTACKKDLSTNVIQQNAGMLTADQQMNAVSGTTTLTLQPGPKDGDDLWIKNWIGHPTYADTCDSKVGLVKGLTYTLNGSVVYTRSIIKFDGLSSVPSNANIVSATLYLYGPTPSSKDVSKHLPMGNTSYPGSTKGDNSCLLQRITSNWNASTICWNNPPVSTTVDQFEMPASNKQWKYDVAMDVSAMVKMMIASPSANNGFLLKLKTEELPRAMGFLSANATEQDRRPKLVVSYN